MPKPGDRIIHFARSIGYEVHFVDTISRRDYDPLLAGYVTMGYTDYERRTIQVLNTGVDGEIFLVLAHEVGHALAARRMRIDHLSARRRRYVRTGEARAFLYGWGVLCRYAPGIVSREVWREFHADADVDAARRIA